MTKNSMLRLKAKIAKLTAEMSRLKERRDEVVRTRRTSEASRVFGDISATQRRLDTAKRLLA